MYMQLGFCPMFSSKDCSNFMHFPSTQFQLFDAALMFPSCALQELEHEASPLTFTDVKEPALTLPMAAVQWM